MQNDLWKKQGALLAGISCCFGAKFALCPSYLIALPAAALFFTAGVKRSFFALLVFGASFLFTNLNHTLTSLPSEGVSGTAIFCPESIQSITRWGKQSWFYKGKIAYFLDETGTVILKNVPTTLKVPENGPKGDCWFALSGKVFQSKAGNYYLRLPKEPRFVEIQEKQSLARSRFLLKSRITNYLKKQMPHSTSSGFIAGLATGDFEDSLMKKEFGRFGLQHIMAISGFHFSLIASMIAFLLKPWLSEKKVSISLILLLSLYFLFLGLTPSVLRAFIMVLVTMAATFSQKTSPGLNALGISLIVIVVIDPILVTHMGFQFSAITTASILLFTQLFQSKLVVLFGVRKKFECLQFGRVDQHLYLVNLLFAKALALTLAVNITAIPLTLYFFGSFPVFSLLYNLFFPFLVSVSLFLSLIASLLSITGIGAYIHTFNSFFTKYSLDLIYNMPPEKDLFINSQWVGPGVIVLYFSALFGAIIIQKSKLDYKNGNLV